MLLALILSTLSHAATKPIYSMSGKTVDVTTALMGAINGKEVWACKPVVAKLNERGTSYSLKNKKDE